MARYKYENGSSRTNDGRIIEQGYYRQASNGDWFKVERKPDGTFTWVLPNGQRVIDRMGKNIVEGESYATVALGPSTIRVPQGLVAHSIKYQPRETSSSNTALAALPVALVAAPATGGTSVLPYIAGATALTISAKEGYDQLKDSGMGNFLNLTYAAVRDRLSDFFNRSDNSSTDNTASDTTTLLNDTVLATNRTTPPSNNLDPEEKKKLFERIKKAITPNSEKVKKGLKKTGIFVGTSALIPPTLDVLGNLGQEFGSEEHNWKWPVTSNTYGFIPNIYNTWSDTYYGPEAVESLNSLPKDNSTTASSDSTYTIDHSAMENYLNNLNGNH